MEEVFEWSIVEGGDQGIATSYTVLILTKLFAFCSEPTLFLFFFYLSIYISIVSSVFQFVVSLELPHIPHLLDMCEGDMESNPPLYYHLEFRLSLLL